MHKSMDSEGGKMDDTELIPHVEKYSEQCSSASTVCHPNMNCSFVAWVGKPSSQPGVHFPFSNGFIHLFFCFLFPSFFFSFFLERVWGKSGSLEREPRQNSPASEVVKDICSWPQTPPAAAALIQALLQGLSQALALGMGTPTNFLQRFCSASFPSLCFKRNSLHPEYVCLKAF